MADDSFIRFIKGVASEHEQDHWENWQNLHTNHQVLIEQSKELIQFTAFEERQVPDPRAELKKLEFLIERNNQALKKTRVNSRGHIPGRRTGSYWWFSAAAMVMVALSASFFFNQLGVPEVNETEQVTIHTKSEFHTSYGEKATLQLTNGSRIILNSNSNLTYSFTGTGGGYRVMDIHLRGEAWFDIIPDHTNGDRIFRIHTPDGIVEVLGTTFAVQTSPKGTRAVLEKGKIRINSNTLREIETEIDNAMIMMPGQMARLFSGSGKIELYDVNPDLYTSWIRDVWMFEQTPLIEVAQRIETLFGVTVEISSTELQEKTLSGSIGSGNLSLIKKGISEALNEDVFQRGNRIIIGS